MIVSIAKNSSGHVPIKVQIEIHIPKCQIFRFEEFWAEFEAFIDTVDNY